LLATTRQFLDDLGLASLEQLPAIDGAPSAGAMLAQALPDQPDLIDAQAALALELPAEPQESAPEPREPTAERNDDIVVSVSSSDPDPESAADAAPMEPQA
jgi:segregation and condensation protein B